MSKNPKRFLKKAAAIFLSVALLGSIAVTVSASGNYDNTEQSRISQAKAIEAESEGIVLLKNGNIAGGQKSLPLSTSTKVNVFGRAASNPYYDGGGSGATTASSRRVTFYNALTAAGIQFNAPLRAYYDAYTGGTNEGVSQARNEIPFDTLSASTAYIDAIADPEYDTAIVVLGRVGQESSDVGATALYLKPSEDALIKAVGAAHSNVIILFDTCETMDSDFVEDPAYGVDSAMYVWAPGCFGFTAVADTLLGKYNPSGRLVDTIVDDPQANPSYLNFGTFQYTGTFPVSNNPTGTNWNTSSANNQNKFLEYEEGIYVGYRYWETFAPERVVYPFGYGLSYTTFAWSNYQQSLVGDKVTVKVDVRNSGTVAGKDVVEIYVEQPYTTGGIEKAKRVLAGYGKTSLLAAGASETVTVTFSLYDIASWDTANGRYIAESGTYRVFASKNASESGKVLNGTFSLASNRIFTTDPKTGTELVNQFADARGEGTVLSRADHDGTFPTKPTTNTRAMPDAYRAAIDKFPAPVTEGTAFPFSATQGADPVQLQAIYDGAEAAVLAGTYDNMDDALWNSPLWNSFLSQLTLAEAVELCSRGGYQTIGNARLGIPRTIDNDGPQQAKARSSGIGGNGTAMPIATALACTWNVDLLEEVGDCHGKDAVIVGIHSWYAPALNIHRTPYSGRNFEYYSEDPLVSGKCAAAITRGVQSNHVSVTLKHFAVNDCEANRSGVNTWLDEQTLREIYLKAFEIGVKEGKPTGMMSAFNRIGYVWAGGSKALITNVLRNEWGFRGYVVTDYFSAAYMLPPLMILAQNDISLNNASQPSMINYNNDLDPIGMSNALARSVKNLCFMKMRTYHFAGDEVIEFPPAPDPIETLSGTFKWQVTGYDWGPAINKIIIDTGDQMVNNSDLADDGYFGVRTATGTSTTPNRTITRTYVSDAEGNEMVLPGTYVTIEMAVAQNVGSPFTYDFRSGLNSWTANYNVAVTLLKPIGDYGFINLTNAGKYTPESDKFDITGSYTLDGVSLTYASYAPPADDKKNPVVIWLHGAGEGGTDPLITLYGNKVVNLASDDIQNCFDGAYVLTPQAPTYWMNNGNNQYTTNGYSMYTPALMGLIQKYVSSNPDIDPSRVYIGGCSNGGYMTLRMLISYPDYFAAAYPICAAYTSSWITEPELQSMVNTPIWFTHAIADPTVNYANSTVATFNRLIAAGAKNVHVHERPNVNPYNNHWSWVHTLNNEAPCTADASTLLSNCPGDCEDVTIMDWMAAQVKANSNFTVQSGATVTLPITVNYADLLSGVKGTIEYDEDLLTLQSLSGISGFVLQSNGGKKFTAVTVDGMGVNGNVVIGYAIFTAKAGLLDDVTTTVSFPTAGLSAFHENGKTVEPLILPAMDVTILGEPPISGDVNLDGKVDLADAILLMQYLSGNTPLSSKQLKAADVSKDGLVNVGDTIIIMQMCLEG